MTLYYTDALGNFIGGFDNVNPPPGSLLVPAPPVRSPATWNGSIWIYPNPPLQSASLLEILRFGCPGPIGTASLLTRYLAQGTTPPLLAEPQIKIRRPCELRYLELRATLGPGSTRTDTVTVRKNGVDTSLSTSITGASEYADVTGAFIEYAIGDLLSLKIVIAALSGTANPMASLELHRP